MHLKVVADLQLLPLFKTFLAKNSVKNVKAFTRSLLNRPVFTLKYQFGPL